MREKEMGTYQFDLGNRGVIESSCIKLIPRVVTLVLFAKNCRTLTSNLPFPFALGEIEALDHSVGWVGIG